MKCNKCDNKLRVSDSYPDILWCDKCKDGWTIEQLEEMDKVILDNKQKDDLFFQLEKESKMSAIVNHFLQNTKDRIVTEDEISKVQALILEVCNQEEEKINSLQLTKLEKESKINDLDTEYEYYVDQLEQHFDMQNVGMC